MTLGRSRFRDITVSIANATALVLLSSLVAVSDASSEAARSRNHVVNVVSDEAAGRMYFEPRMLFINPGDTVTWINRGDEEHDIITFPDGYPEGTNAFQSPLFEHAGERWSHLFVKQGTYEYHCLPHLPMGMRGMIIVGRPSEQGEFHAPSSAEVAAYRQQMLEWFGDDVAFELREQRDQTIPPQSN
jgi:pseudoazurin